MNHSVDTPIFETNLVNDIKTIKEKMNICNTYKKVDAVIKDGEGRIIFEKKGVESPSNWNQLSINIAAEKYFIKEGPLEENSIRQMCSRVAKAIGKGALKNGYLDISSTYDDFVNVLESLLENQYFCFNSPVWFNVGVDNKPPQISACYIVGIEDTMESILEAGKIEGMIYKGGSGSGINYSKLRGKGEKLSRGGKSSGVMSFVKAHDSIGGAIKSGGNTRRSAKLVCLNVDHPDIEEFIESKNIEEKKAQALIAAGFDGDFRAEGGAYQSVMYQNANHSVRVTDSFMEAVEKDGNWNLMSRVSGKPFKTIKAKELFRKISEAAWKSGDPGLMFDTEINKWNTLKADGNINGANPCIEFMSLDNTSCNLASINLMKFYDESCKHSFDWELFGVVSKFVTLCLDILICDASYPTKEITKNSLDYRQVGLGHGNLGSLLMATGHAYDSDEGRSVAAKITSLMTASAFKQSTYTASKVGPFSAFEKNKNSMFSVLEKHASESASDTNLDSADSDHWGEVLKLASVYGLRNSYVSNEAPMGTIGLVMGCDTTGVEPELSLIKHKKLVGGGLEKIVNGTVTLSLRNLGYGEVAVESILSYIKDNGSVSKCEVLKPEHKKVFATSFDPSGNYIAWEGHINMLAAIQPYLSGSISKTTNMPSESSVEDIESAYTSAWKKKLKAIAIYRDGCKQSQPLSAEGKKESKVEEKEKNCEEAHRRRLPRERDSKTHKFEISGHSGYLTVGLYPEGTPGELFVNMSKSGSTISGLLETISILFSMAIQYGVPLDKIISKLKGSSFEPSGVTNNSRIRMAKSPVDYVARYLELFLKKDANAGVVEDAKEKNALKSKILSLDVTPCSNCGSLDIVQTGTCTTCNNCSQSGGCG
jgi:ribonucleoside-diphosphate reductase alpha chain